jgi:hypothetical protein
VTKIAQRVKKTAYNRNESEKNLSWVINALGGSTVFACIPLFMYVFSIMRFYADVTPLLIALAVVGFWVGYRAIESSALGQFVYAGFGILLAGISILVPNLLALHSSERLIEYSPQVFTSVDAFIKSFSH